jgi:hypothetical protein
MASIVDKTYFFGEILIGQLSELAVQDKVANFIDMYEPEFLEGILGYVSYKNFLLTPPDQKWLDLLNGKEYVDEYGVTRNWKGLKFTTGTIKQSPIAFYIYYWYQRSQLTNTAGVGEVKAHSENGYTASPKYKMVNAWNKMVDSVIELYSFMRANQLIYSDWYTWASNNNSNTKFLKTINTFGL